MEKLLKILTQKRLKSLYWRAGMMVIAGILSAVVDGAADLNIPSWGVVGLGLVLGEISKYLNTK